jgi:hypothetical protein
MFTRNSKLAALLAVSLLLLASLACSIGGSVRVGALQNKSETVELGEAESVDVLIDMGAGTLDINGGAAALLEADFAYNVDDIEPEVSYSDGNLSIRQGDADVGVRSLFQTAEFRNDWDLRLNESVPMTLDVNFGAGRSELNLGTLDLSRLDVDTGAGEVTIDLAGVGSLSNFTLSMGAGEVTIDLTGDWTRDLNATIDGGLGELTVRLPSGVGVRVNVSTGLGDVNAGGLTRDGEYYVNDLYGESEVTLFITVNAGVGQVNLVTE